MEKTNILKPLKIGNLVAKRPVIQSAMPLDDAEPMQ